MQEILGTYVYHRRGSDTSAVDSVLGTGWVKVKKRRRWGRVDDVVGVKESEKGKRRKARNERRRRQQEEWMLEREERVREEREEMKRREEREKVIEDVKRDMFSSFDGDLSNFQDEFCGGQRVSAIENISIASRMIIARAIYEEYLYKRRSRMTDEFLKWMTLSIGFSIPTLLSGAGRVTLFGIDFPQF